MQESILVFFQNNSSQFLDIAAEGITIMGEQTIYICVIALLNWCISKKNAFILTVSLLFTVLVNGILKIAFRMPRPFEVLDYIEAGRLHTATGYSFPSGHTQSGTTFYFTAACLIRSPLAWTAASVLSLLIAVSRLYLGVHWLRDVIVSLFLGIIIALAVSHMIMRVWNTHSQLQSFMSVMTGVVLLALVVMFIFEFCFFKGNVRTHDFFKGTGVFLGTLTGFFLERKYVNFSSEKGTFKIKVLRYLTGIIFLILTLYGLKILLPDHVISHTIRYAILGLMMTFLYPLLGTRLSLF